MPDELVDGIRMVVNAQVDVAVVAPLVPAAVADDQQRRGLPSALVPARRVAGHERGQQPVAQVALGLGERAGELGHDGLPRKDVALRGEAVAGDASGPRHALQAGERRRMPGRVDEPHLAIFPAVVGRRAAGPARAARRRRPPSAPALPGRTRCSPTTASRRPPCPRGAHGTTAPDARELRRHGDPQSPAATSAATIENVILRSPPSHQLERRLIVGQVLEHQAGADRHRLERPLRRSGPPPRTPARAACPDPRSMLPRP